MTLHIPHTTVIRLSRGTFDPVRRSEVERMVELTGAYMVPAIKKLPGFMAYYAGVSPAGSLTHISLWQSEAMANNLSHIREMADAKRATDSVGVALQPIVNYQIVWHVRAEPQAAHEHGAPSHG